MLVTVWGSGLVVECPLSSLLNTLSWPVRGPADNFNSHLSIITQIWGEICFIVITFLVVRLLNHVSMPSMTAQLLCHVQNFVAITLLEYRWEQNEISNTLNKSSSHGANFADFSCATQPMFQVLDKSDGWFKLLSVTYILFRYQKNQIVSIKSDNGTAQVYVARASAGTMLTLIWW